MQLGRKTSTIVRVGMVLLVATLSIRTVHALHWRGLGEATRSQVGIEPAQPFWAHSQLQITPTDADRENAESSDHSKLGIHGILADGIVALARRAVDGGTHLSVVKAVDDLSYLATVKEISPETITVARLTSPQESADAVNDPATDLQGYAVVIMDVIFDKIAQAPELVGVVDYWEPINEPLGGGVPTQAYERLAQLMIYCMELAEERGLRLALFSFSAGTPEWADMTAIIETGVFTRAKAGDHILALHEGVFGDDPIDLYYGPQHTIPGAPEIRATGSLCGRYRYWYHLLEGRDEVVPLFISEFYAGGGYGNEANIEDIVQRMAWYDDQLQRDDYVLGFAPFTLGSVGEWVDQDYGFVYPALLAHLMGVVYQEHPFFLPVLMNAAATPLPVGPEATPSPETVETAQPTATPTRITPSPQAAQEPTPTVSPPKVVDSPLPLPTPLSLIDQGEVVAPDEDSQGVVLLVAGAVLGLLGGWLSAILFLRRRRT